MGSSLNLSSLRTYLAFPFQDRDAVNRFLVGGALYIAGSIIPILPLIPALGYQYQIMQRVIAGEGPGMPAWEDWGRLFKDGLKLFLIGAVYLLPGCVFMFGGYAIYMVTFFAMLGSGRNPSSGQAFGFLGGIAALFIGMSVGMLLFLLGSLPLPLAAAHAVAQDRTSAAFYVPGWWPILRRSLGDFIVVWIVFYGLFALLYMVFAILYMTIILCLALPLVLGALSFYMLLSGSAMFASIYRQSSGELPAREAPAVPPAPVETAGQSELAPASGEMIGVETANLTAAVPSAPQTRATPESVAQAFAPELPTIPEPPAPNDDPNATRLLSRQALDEAAALAASELPTPPEAASDSQATRRLPSADDPASNNPPQS